MEVVLYTYIPIYLYTYIPIYLSHLHTYISIYLYAYIPISPIYLYTQNLSQFPKCPPKKGAAACAKRLYPPHPLRMPGVWVYLLNYKRDDIAPLFSVKFPHAFSARFYSTFGPHFGPFLALFKLKNQFVSHHAEKHATSKKHNKTNGVSMILELRGHQTPLK